jgi:hypothetical protein
VADSVYGVNPEMVQCLQVEGVAEDEENNNVEIPPQVAQYFHADDEDYYSEDGEEYIGDNINKHVSHNINDDDSDDSDDDEHIDYKLEAENRQRILNERNFLNNESNRVDKVDYPDNNIFWIDGVKCNKPKFVMGDSNNEDDYDEDEDDEDYEDVVKYGNSECIKKQLINLGYYPFGFNDRVIKLDGYDINLSDEFIGESCPIPLRQFLEEIEFGDYYRCFNGDDHPEKYVASVLIYKLRQLNKINRPIHFLKRKVAIYNEDFGEWEYYGYYDDKFIRLLKYAIECIKEYTKNWLNDRRNYNSCNCLQKNISGTGGEGEAKVVDVIYYINLLLEGEDI